MLRPLYQVSDEIVYLSTVQAVAFGIAPVGLAPCLAPPAGTRPAIAAQAKPGFLRATSRQLVWLCELGAGDRSLLLLRLLQALSLPVVAACAWAIARTITGRAEDALLAGVLVAAHPVAATHAGGVTPDAWANAFSAVAFLSATRVLVGGGRGWDLLAVVAAPLLALAWKDTATFLLALPLSVMAVQVAQSYRNAGTTALRLAGLVLSAGLVAVAGLVWFRTPYLASPGAAGAPRDAAVWVRAVLGDLLAQLPGLATSSWTGIGNFGASTLTTAAVANVIGVLLLVAGLVGAFVRLPQAPAPRRLLAIGIVWAMSAGLCVAQPSIRQVLLSTQDVHQGRWLFPLLAPAAVFLACGINGLVTGRRLLPLATLAMSVVSISAALETTRYYWDAIPSQLRTASLFIRGTGGAVVDDALVLSLIRHASTYVPDVTVVAPLTLAALGVACLAHGVTLLTAGSHVSHAHDR